MNDACRILEITYPIILGGMGNVSSIELTSAVSEAGGLGTFGVGTRTPQEIELYIQGIKEKSKKPFAINIPLTVTPYVEEIAELIIRYQVPVVSLSAGNPSKWIRFFKDHGVKVMTVVGSVKQARKAEQEGADLVVGEGYEAAGINSPYETTTVALIPQIVDAVQIPVIAAGGIGDARGLVGAFALGAQGVQMGTRFIVAKEAPFSERYKEKILAANDEATTIVGRSVGRIRRVLKTPYVEKLLSLENEGISTEDFMNLTSEKYHWLGAMEGNDQEGYMNSGQIAGALKNIQSVKEIIESMMKEAAMISQRLKETFSHPY